MVRNPSCFALVLFISLYRIPYSHSLVSNVRPVAPSIMAITLLLGIQQRSSSICCLKKGNGSHETTDGTKTGSSSLPGAGVAALSAAGRAGDAAGGRGYGGAIGTGNGSGSGGTSASGDDGGGGSAARAGVGGSGRAGRLGREVGGAVVLAELFWK